MENDNRTQYSSPQDMIKRFMYIDKLSDDKAYSLVKEEYKNFLSVTIDDPSMYSIKRSTRFISMLIQVCIDVHLTYEERVYLNSMIYKELVTITNPYLQNLYYTLGMVANNNVVSNLMDKCKLDKTLASYLAVTRKSSFDMRKNISRMNFTIMCSGLNLDTIESIYRYTIKNIEDKTILFLDHIKDTYILRSDEQWITDKVLQTANDMDTAILRLIESTCSIFEIVSILLAYYDEVYKKNLDIDDVRISMKDIDVKLYPKINAALINLANTNIYFP